MAYRDEALPDPGCAVTGPGRYGGDDRVVRHGGDGTWRVFHARVEYNGAQLRRGQEPIPGLYGAFNADGGRVSGVDDGPFNDVVRALIGDPR